MVLLHVSAFSKHSFASMQEHAGCPVVFKHTLGASHGAKVGALLLHWHNDGVAVVLHVSVVFGQWLTVKHEHSYAASTSPYVIPVAFAQYRPVSHAA